MKRLILILTLALVAGCSTLPKNFSDSLTLVDKFAEIAAAHNASYSADLRFDGDMNVYAKQSFGADSGITLHLHFQANAATAKDDDGTE